MAMIKCPECGVEVSSKAKNCPSCGYPIASAEKKTARKVKLKETLGLQRRVAGIICLVTFFMILGGGGIEDSSLGGLGVYLRMVVGWSFIGSLIWYFILVVKMK